MDLAYCDKWSATKKKPWTVIDIDKAQNNHINNIPYTAIVQKNGNVKSVVEIADKYITVAFMNEKMSPYLFYNFDIKDSSNIFLSSAYYYSYDEKGDDELELVAFRFTENGHIIMERRNYITGDVEEKYLNGDVGPNWDKFPEFGEYEHLLREEREVVIVSDV